MNYPDYYKVLNVKNNASMAEIKEAYHAMVKKYHPDINKNNKKAEEKLKQINAAYAVLKNYAKRAEYDYHRRNKAINSVENTQAAPKQYGFRVWITKFFLLLFLIMYILFLFQYRDKDKPYNILLTLNNAAEEMEAIPQKLLNSALIKAVEYDNVKSVAWLLKSGANAEQYDERGYNLLMLTDNPQIAELLILHNAKVNYTAADGNSPLQQAVNNQNQEIKKILFKYGAKMPWKK